MNHELLLRLHTEFFGYTDAHGEHAPGLAQITSCPAWDGANARAIGVVQWREVFVVAMILANQLPHLPLPKPGADASGFIWLTWDDGRASLALEVHPGLLVRNLYEWTATSMGIPRRHTGVSLRNVVDGLRAVFGEPPAKEMSCSA